MKIIVQTPSSETVPTLSCIYQTKFSLEKISLDIHLMIDALSINQETLSRRFGKVFTKSYALKKLFLYILVNFKHLCGPNCIINHDHHDKEHSCSNNCIKIKVDGGY